MKRLKKFIEANKSSMLADLEDIVKYCKDDLKSDPETYTARGCDEPSIDVRLCIDLDGSRDSWIIRTGLSDYDPYFSDYCAASCVTLDTKASKLLDELINQIFE